jgi:hypothetical protein
MSFKSRSSKGNHYKQGNYGSSHYQKKAFWVICLMCLVREVALGAITKITVTNLTRRNTAILKGSRIHHQFSKILSHAVSAIPGFRQVQSSV